VQVHAALAQREGAEQTLGFVRLGHVDALGFTIGCITIRRIKISLEWRLAIRSAAKLEGLSKQLKVTPQQGHP
jgi:hypothetical protein